jgi:hypothetical protein
METKTVAYKASNGSIAYGKFTVESVAKLKRNHKVIAVAKTVSAVKVKASLNKA